MPTAWRDRRAGRPGAPAAAALAAQPARWTATRPPPRRPNTGSACGRAVARRTRAAGGALAVEPAPVRPRAAQPRRARPARLPAQLSQPALAPGALWPRRAGGDAGGRAEPVGLAPAAPIDERARGHVALLRATFPAGARRPRRAVCRCSAKSARCAPRPASPTTATSNRCSAAAAVWPPAAAGGDAPLRDRPPDAWRRGWTTRRSSSSARQLRPQRLAGRPRTAAC